METVRASVSSWTGHSYLTHGIHERVQQVLLDAAPEIAALHEFPETHDEIQAGDHDKDLVVK